MSLIPFEFCFASIWVNQAGGLPPQCVSVRGSNRSVHEARLGGAELRVGGGGGGCSAWPEAQLPGAFPGCHFGSWVPVRPVCQVRAAGVEQGAAAPLTEL